MFYWRSWFISIHILRRIPLTLIDSTFFTFQYIVAFLIFASILVLKLFQEEKYQSNIFIIIILIEEYVLVVAHSENINFLLYFKLPTSITSERHSWLWQKICERNPIYFGHGVDKPIIRGYKKYIVLTSNDAGQRDYWWHDRILRMIYLTPLGARVIYNGRLCGYFMEKEYKHIITICGYHTFLFFLQCS